jgi:hypothetical protein
MWSVYYLCSYRPVWYLAADYTSYAAAVVAAVYLHASGRKAVQVQDRDGTVLLTLYAQEKAHA